LESASEEEPALSTIGDTPAGRLRLRSWVLRDTAIVAASIALLGIVGGAYLASLPGVGDAEARVRAILAAHGGTPSAMPPPARLAESVVAVEDENFHSNVAIGILDGVGRAALAVLQRGGDPGGSTIGQQLAKTLYPHGGGLGGTLEEIGLAVKLSLHYSKAQSLNMYLNSVYYGHGYWGDIAAVRGYFGLSARRLSWGQASLLAGLPQAPAAYDPERHPGLARRRQLHVLDQLVDSGKLSQAHADVALREPWRLRRSAPGAYSPATSRRRKTVKASASAGSE
jgi:membrane peptidoglycan carboxypeptidase